MRFVPKIISLIFNISMNNSKWYRVAELHDFLFVMSEICYFYNHPQIVYKEP